MARFSVAFTVIVSSSMSAAKRRHQCTVGRAINVSFASGICNSGGDLCSYSRGGGGGSDGISGSNITERQKYARAMIIRRRQK